MYQKLFFDVLEVSIDEVEERMYIRKKDGSFWVCGEEVGAKKNFLWSGGRCKRAYLYRTAHAAYFKNRVETEK